MPNDKKARHKGDIMAGRTGAGSARIHTEDNMKELYLLLPEGKSNAIPISEVAALWGVPERRARKMIGQMWNHNMPVCNLFGGYFRPESILELKSHWRIIRAYKCNFERKEYRIRRCIEQFDNVTMDYTTLP